MNDTNFAQLAKPRAGGTPEQRKAGWMDLLEKVRTDPNVAKTLIHFGTSLMQPRPIGQSSGGHVGSALSQSVAYLQQQRQLQEAQALAKRNEARTDKGLGLQERQVVAQEQQVNNQTRSTDASITGAEEDRGYRERRFAWEQSLAGRQETRADREAASLQQFRVWQQSNKGHPQVTLIQTLADNKVAANPELYQGEAGKAKAFEDAFAEFSGRGSLPKTRTQFIASTIAKGMADIAANPLADENALPNFIQMVTAAADTLYPTQTPAGGPGGERPPVTTPQVFKANMVPVMNQAYVSESGRPIGTFLGTRVENGQRVYLFRDASNEIISVEID